MVRIYGLLLRLYPAWLVDEFGEEMTTVWTELHREIRREGALARVRFFLREIYGLLSGALREHLKKQNRNLSGGNMRSFRFSRWIIVMMILMFCAVNTAIERGRLASVQLMTGGPGTSHWWALPGVFLTVFAFLGVVGCIGYCILHLVRTVRGTRA